MFNGIENWAPIADADRRPVTTSKGLGVLKNVGAMISAYGLNENETLTFPEGMNADNAEVGEQAPRRPGQRTTKLVPCLVDGKQTYINPMFFLRTKIENGRSVPVYPKWQALGDAEQVMIQLIAQGGIKAGKNMDVQVADFEDDGTPKYIAAVDEKGNKIVNSDGSFKRVRATVTRQFPSLPDPKKA